MNNTLKAALQKMVNDKMTIGINYLTTYFVLIGHDSIRYTPFFLMYGSEARFFIDAERLKKETIHSQDLSFDKKVEIMIGLDPRKKIQQQAIGNKHNAQARQKRQYDVKNNQKTDINVRFPPAVVKAISWIRAPYRYLHKNLAGK